MLLEIQTNDQLQKAVSELQPANEQYAKLQQALECYHSLEKKSQGVFPPIPSNVKIKPDEKNVIIPMIRRKLSMTDVKVYPMVIDTVSGLQDSLLYDSALADAIKLFQLRHGLEQDGIIGEKTLKFLNQSFHEKAEVIAINMERIRWMPENYGDHYILVNVPEYKLRVYENHKQQLEMKVIVGASNKPTPVFNDELDYIVFSPTWTVPFSIIK
jgi:murein L,D-transpeptidase YcbB/YkuD